MERIPPGLKLMYSVLDQPAPQDIEPVADRCVVDIIPDLDDQSADQCGVDLQADDRRRPEHLGEALRKLVPFLLGQGDSRSDCYRLAVLATIPDRACLADDRGEDAEPIMSVEDAQKTYDRRQSPAIERRHE
jgi:hypothetical protein